MNFDLHGGATRFGINDGKDLNLKFDLFLTLKLASTQNK